MPVLTVFLLMIPESAGIVVPSEPVLLAAGAAHIGLIAAIIAGTAGNVVGSILLYEFGHRTRTRLRGGKAAKAVAKCDQLFAKRGTSTVFIARLMPLARSFVSFPAGRARIPRGLFVALTTAGCAIWATLFVTGGALAGSAYTEVGAAVRYVTIAAAAVLTAAWVLRKRRQRDSTGT